MVMLSLLLVVLLLQNNCQAFLHVWDLWYASRGPRAAKELLATGQLVAAQGQPEAWKEAEDMLRVLIAREGIHWVEPVNRLATLMFLQNRYEESLELCLLVLALKPWHMGALSGIVMVYQGLQDNQNMLKYALQRMPPLPRSKEEAAKMEQQALLAASSATTNNNGDALVIETRQMWVYRMVDKAKAALLRNEMGLEESFQDLDGPKEATPTNSEGGGVSGSQISEDDDEYGVWQ